MFFCCVYAFHYVTHQHCNSYKFCETWKKQTFGFATVAVQYNLFHEISKNALLSVVFFVCCVKMHVTLVCAGVCNLPMWLHLLRESDFTHQTSVFVFLQYLYTKQRLPHVSFALEMGSFPLDLLLLSGFRSILLLLETGLGDLTFPYGFYLLLYPL